MHMEIREKQFQNTKMTENVKFSLVADLLNIHNIFIHITKNELYPLVFQSFLPDNIYKLSFIELYVLFIGNHNLIY